MNAVATERTMTVKEISLAMEVPTRTIHDAIDRLFPGKKKNGVTTYLNQQEVAALSMELKRSHNVDLASIRKVATTDMEMVEKTREVMGWLQQKAETLEKENRVLKIKADVADRLVNSDGLFCLTDVCKAINAHPRKMMWWMEDEEILYRRKSTGVLLPQSVFQDRGYFEVKINTYGGAKTMVTKKGLAWICAKWNKAHNLLPFPPVGA